MDNLLPTDMLERWRCYLSNEAANDVRRWNSESPVIVYKLEIQEPELVIAVALALVLVEL